MTPAAVHYGQAQMPEPRLVAALGNCALGHNLLGQTDEHAGPLEDILPVDLRIPGCPPTPTTIAAALSAALDQRVPVPSR